MEQKYPRFTPEMKKTHKILIPNMAPVQFRILAASMENHGYQVELLGNCGERVAELGLKYVHNDTCYPALLVIGHWILASMIWTTPPSSSLRPAAAAGPLITSFCYERRWKKPVMEIFPFSA